MSLSKAPPSEFRASLPGKVFLLGEYAVLAGATALVAAVGPRFEARPGAFFPHPLSPAGRLIDRIGARFSFVDPYDGRGGFGGSTAEFLLAYLWLSRRDPAQYPADWKSAWKAYRALSGGRASGADLSAQWLGGVVAFSSARAEVDVALEARALTAPRISASLLAFSAAGLPGRKVKTHEHLSALDKAAFLPLRAPLERGLAAFGSDDAPAFGHTLSTYAEAIAALGLECEGARDDRRALSALPGVLGAKGCGALLSDAVIVAVAPGTARFTVIEAARARGLALVADGLREEEGLRWE